MKNFLKVIETKSAIIIYLSLISIILALVLGMAGLKVPLRVGYIFILVNFAISLFIGYWIKKSELNFFWILVWPLLFSLMVFARYADYNYFFSVIYLLISILGFNYKNTYR